MCDFQIIETLLCRRAGQAAGNRFGAGSGQIWLDNVQCSGIETRLDFCRHSAWGATSDCQHSEDVSIVCNAVTPTVTTATTVSPARPPIAVAAGAGVYMLLLFVNSNHTLFYPQPMALCSQSSYEYAFSNSHETVIRCSWLQISGRSRSTEDRTIEIMHTTV